MPEVIKRMEILIRHFIGLGFANPSKDDENPMEMVARHAMGHGVKNYAVQIATRMSGTILLSKDLSLVWMHVYQKELPKGSMGKIKFQIQGNREKFADFIADTAELFSGLKVKGGSYHV